MTDFAGLLRAMAEAKVRFVLVGGAAAIAHGSARHTLDVDVVYDRDPENVRRLTEALAPYNPYLRGAPPGLPFRWDAQTLCNGLNFTLTTSLGDVDLLGEIVGGGRYQDLAAHSITLHAFGIECLCLDLIHLIRAKRAAGRPKDFEAIAELEALAEEQERQNEN